MNGNNDARIEIGEESASIINGKIKACVSIWKILFTMKKGIFAGEYSRNRRDLLDENAARLKWKPESSSRL